MSASGRFLVPSGWMIRFILCGGTFSKCCSAREAYHGCNITRIIPKKENLPGVIRSQKRMMPRQIKKKPYHNHSTVCRILWSKRYRAHEKLCHLSCRWHSLSHAIRTTCTKSLRNVPTMWDTWHKTCWRRKLPKLQLHLQRPSFFRHRGTVIWDWASTVGKAFVSLGKTRCSQ